MTYDGLVEMVVTCFLEDVKEGGFESFDEMVKCYMFDSKDIKREVEYLINFSGYAWLDEEGITIFGDDSYYPYPYRKFIASVRNHLK